MTVSELPNSAPATLEELTDQRAWHKTALSLARQQPMGAAGLFIVLMMLFMAFFAEFIAPFDPEANDFEFMLTAPNSTYWLGTDQFGRDQLTRIIYGARTALYVGFVCAFVGAFAAFNAAVFTRMALPEMTKYGYSKRLSAGCIAASGTLASLIPPSILMVVYAIITEQSVGVLLIPGLVANISDILLGLQLSPYLYLASFAFVYLIPGMLIDPIAIMVMTLPVMFPILTGAGFDPIWLGVIAIKLAEISLITPPVGLNVYVVRSASPIPLTLEDVFAGIMPFLFLDILTLGLLIAFPQIVLFLPSLMF